MRSSGITSLKNINATMAAFQLTSKNTRRRAPRFNRGVPKAEERSDEAGMLS